VQPPPDSTSPDRPADHGRLLPSRLHHSKTRAIRVALEERKQRLAMRVVRRDRGQALRRFLAQEVRPKVLAKALGRRVIRREREAILGYGPKGV